VYSCDEGKEVDVVKDLRLSDITDDLNAVEFLLCKSSGWCRPKFLYMAPTGKNA